MSNFLCAEGAGVAEASGSQHIKQISVLPNLRSVVDFSFGGMTA